MNQLNEKKVIQAVLIADNFNDNLAPLTNGINTSLLPLVNTPLIDYALEALNRCGIEEVFVFCCDFMDKVKEHVNERISQKCSWSVEMEIHFVGSEGCRCLGDVLRDLEAKHLITGHFVLLSADTITNAALQTILNEHIQMYNADIGTAMTVVYKVTSPAPRTGDEVIIVRDNNRLLFHQRLDRKQRAVAFPSELFPFNSTVLIQPDIIDPQIAICSPFVLTLFSDNFDYLTRDDFIRNILNNDKFVRHSIYVRLLPAEQYATKISDWRTYKNVSIDVMNGWVYPLVPDMGICCLEQKYLFLPNNIYRNKCCQLAKNSIMEDSFVDDNSVLSFSVVGKNCKIGKHCKLEYAFLMDNVTIEDNCELIYCVIGKNSIIKKNTSITHGTVIGNDVIIPEKSSLLNLHIQSSNDIDDGSDAVEELGDSANIVSTINETLTNADSDGDDEDGNELSVKKIKQIYISKEEDDVDASSIYNSSSNEDISECAIPILEDSNVFFSEVLDLLSKCLDVKSKTEYLILEINSSRYANNVTLAEVNFNVVKAIFNLKPIKLNTNGNIFVAFKEMLQHLGPVMRNYIRDDMSMNDCLNAFQECCIKNEELGTKSSLIIHYLYDQDILTEDAILNWYDTSVDESTTMKTSLIKLIDWLRSGDEETTDDGEEESD